MIKVLFGVHVIGLLVASGMCALLVAIGARGTDDSALQSGFYAGVFTSFELLVASPFLVGGLWLCSKVASKARSVMSRTAFTMLALASLSLVAAQAIWASGILIGAVHAGEANGIPSILVIRQGELFTKLLLPVGAAWAVATQLISRGRDLHKGG